MANVPHEQMQFFFRERKPELTTLFYNVTDAQLNHIVNHQYKAFPARFFTQKMFCPMLSLELAKRIAKEKTNWLSHKTEHVHILRFIVRSKFVAKYLRGTLDNDNSFMSLPGDKLNELNQQIIGFVECIESVDLKQFC